MSNNTVVKRHLDPDIFKDFLKDHNTSIRQLGGLCAANERTIRRCVKDEEVTLGVALDLCNYFNCDFNQLFGPDDSYSWNRDKANLFARVK